MDSWSSSILEWVNCLGLVDTTVNNLLELRDGIFFSKFINLISKQKKYDGDNTQDVVLQFIRENYPDFVMENEDKTSQELYLASLLLLHATEEPTLHQPMCNKLKVETQVKIKTFLEKVLCYGRSITRQNIHTAIFDITESIIRTPPMTPKRRPLRDFLNSPATNTAKNLNRIMNERNRELQRIKWELEIERFEKADLQDDLKVQQGKIQMLELKLQEKTADLKKMRDESLRLDMPCSCKKNNDVTPQKIRYRAEINALEDQVVQLKIDVDNLEEEKRLLNRKLNYIEKQCTMLRETNELSTRNLETAVIQSHLKDQKLEELQLQYNELREHLRELQKTSTVEQSFEMETNEESSVLSSLLNTSEPLSSVIEIQLQEEKKHSKLLNCQLEEQNRKLDFIKQDYEILSRKNEGLNVEKLRLLQESKEFEKLILLKDKLLEESQQKNDEVLSYLHDTRFEMKKLQESLDLESNRAAGLEAKIAQLELEKQELLRNTSLIELSIQNLNKTLLEKTSLLDSTKEQLHDAGEQLARNIESIKSLEHEKMDLHERTQDLEHSVSSAQKLLVQSQQTIENLTSNLNDVSTKLADTKLSLEMESIKVKELECTLAETRSQNKQALDLELLKYESLRCENLKIEETKMKLIEETVNLKNMLAETTDLLEQSRQTNLQFEADAIGLKNEITDLKIAVDDERSNLKNLELVMSETRTQYQQALEVESLKYHALNDKYSNLEKEKSNLLGEIKMLKDLFAKTEESLQQAHNKNTNLTSECFSLENKLAAAETTISEKQSRIETLESTITRAQLEHKQALGNEVLKFQTLEQEKIELDEVRSRLLSKIQDMEDLLKSKEELIDDSEHKNNILQSDTVNLNKKLETLHTLLNGEKARVESLEIRVIDMKKTHEDSEKSHDLKYQALEQQHFTVGKENADLLDQMKKLQDSIRCKDDLLKRSQQQIAQFESDMTVVNDKLITAETSLGEQLTTVKNLEALLNQMLLEKEELVKSQLKAYQSLEEKYLNLQEEQANLIQQNKDFQVLISLKEESLKQSADKILHLESNFAALKNEMIAVEDLLDQERSHMRDLEATVAESKLEKEQTLAAQMLTYQTLSDKYSHLEETQLTLLTKNKTLEELLSSKEESLNEVQQKKEELESELLDFRAEFDATKVSLIESRTRITDLESKIVQIQLENEKIRENELLNCEALQKTNENLNSEITLLKVAEKDLFKAQQQLSKQSEDITKLSEQKSHLLEEMRELKTVVSSKDNLLAESQNTSKQLQLTLNELTNELKLIQNLLNTKIVEVNDTNVDLTETGSRKVNVVKAIEELQLKNANYELLIDSLTSILKDVVEQSAVLSGEKLEKIEALSALDLCKQLKTSMNTLERIRCAKEFDMKKFEAISVELNSTISKLKTDLSHFEDMKTKDDRQISKCYEEIKSLKVIAHEKQILLQDIDELQKQICNKDFAISMLEEKNRALVANLQHVQSMIGLCKHDKLHLRKSVEFQNQSIMDCLQDVSALMMQLQNQIRVGAIQLQELNDDKRTLSEQYDEQTKTLVDIQARYERLESEHTSEVKLTQELRNTLESEIKSVSSELNASKKHCMMLENERQKIGQLINNLASSMNNLVSLTIDHPSNSECTYEDSLSGDHEVETKIKPTEISDMSLYNLLGTINDQISLSRKKIAHLLTTVRGLEETIEKERATSNKNFELEQRNTELEVQIKDLQNWHRKFENDLGSIVEAKKVLYELVVKIMSSRSHLNTKLAELKTKLEEIRTTNEDIFTKKKSLCDELKHLKSRNESIEKTISELRYNYLDSLKPINDVLFSMFLWTENKLEQNYTGDTEQKILPTIEILAEDEFSNGKSIIDEELEKHRKMESQITATLKDIDDFMNSVDSYKTSFSLGQIKFEPSAEENLKKQLDIVTKERKEMKDKLDMIRVRNAKLEKNLDDLRKELKKSEGDKPSAADKSQLEELKTRVAQLELEKQELETEKIKLTKRPTEEDFEKRLKEVHEEYDQKLEKIKQKMKTAYNDQVAKTNMEQDRVLQEKLSIQKRQMEELCRKHAEDITKYKQHVEKLTADYWNVGENLLLAEQEKERLTYQVQEVRKRLQSEKTMTDNYSMLQPPVPRSKTTSLDRRDFSMNGREKSVTRSTEVIQEGLTMNYGKRESVKNVRAMQAMGSVFKAEDEEGEVFNINYLADMKAGRCVPAPDVDRLSVLQLRNSLCKPHLKSSYPAETQFQPLTFTEEDIKTGTAEDIFNDSLSQSLLPGEKTKKRDRTQTMYKRPGPPTPSKNGGRLSLQGNELKSPNSRILKEKNVERRSTATPRRLMELFGGSKRPDEYLTNKTAMGWFKQNVTGTPKGRRLSSIFRKQR